MYRVDYHNAWLAEQPMTKEEHSKLFLKFLVALAFLPLGLIHFILAIPSGLVMYFCLWREFVNVLNILNKKHEEKLKNLHR